MKKNEKSVKFIFGDVCYPKSEALILPSNTRGIMSRGILARIVKDGWVGIEKEAKRVSKEQDIKLGECFSTVPGRLKRRGVKKIYHSVIKRLPSDYSSVTIVENALRVAIRRVIEDGMESVTLCGFGIEPGDLDPKSVARIMSDVCKLFQDEIQIKIIDSDKNFIKNLCIFFGEDYEESSE
jgi:O-acetyl-ADP-ribose deacetylase (regulator of RNase III)